MSPQRLVSIGVAAGAVALVVSYGAVAQQQVWSRPGDLAGDELGSSVTYVPDVDGDGVVDFLAGAPGAYPPLFGKVTLYSGATRAVISEFVSDAAGDAWGNLVGDLGDVDGDGARDIAVAAPWRVVPNTKGGAIFVVSGASGAKLFTFTSTPGGQVGLAMNVLGDIDGDGVRDLLYSDNTSLNKYTVYVISGATGATIRTHTNNSTAYGRTIGRAGDVDGDGVDDYAINDVATPQHVYVYSGAKGTNLLTVNWYATAIDAAGDVDLDGYGDLMLDDGFRTIHVVSGASGALLYDLIHPDPGGEGLGVWTSASATGDLDGDGVPDLAAAGVTDLYLVSGVNGATINTYYPTFNARSLDATADVDGDGVFDVLAGDPSAYTTNYYGGLVSLVSGANGSTIASIPGAAIQSRQGAATTLLGDRDGDGWRDLAVVAPNGLVGSSPNLVQIVSGFDGHELARFNTVDAINNYSVQNRTIVTVGDVNGDAIDDYAVACGGGWPPSSSVEVRSGADDSLLTTIFPPSGSPQDLASAAELNGNPLLAAGTYDYATATLHVHVFDLTTGTVVTSYDKHGSSGLRCIGDVNGDGTVDWTVYNPLSWGTVEVFAGGASPTAIWSKSGTQGSPVDRSFAVGDLDGDGIDDVLYTTFRATSNKGKVTALSGKNGALLFDITGPQAGEQFGDVLAPLGDVNLDGVEDFAISAPTYKTEFGPPLGAVFVHSGKNGSLLYRFDGLNSGDLNGITFANVRRHDDTRVDPDPIPDLVVGAPYYDSDRGRVDLHRLEDLMLQVDPPNPLAGASVTLTTRGGPSGNLVGLFAVDLSGTPLGFFLAVGTFDPTGAFAVGGGVPSSLQGLTLDVVAYGINYVGKLADSEVTAIAVR